MLLTPEHLTVIPWRYFTVRIIAKWNEMYPDLRLTPNVHQYKPSTTEFVAVGVGYDEFNRLTVWGLRDDYETGFGEECRKRSQEDQWIQASQVIVEEDYPAFQAAKDFLQFARHRDVTHWLRDRALLKRSMSESAAELRKILPDLEFREAFMKLMK